MRTGLMSAKRWWLLSLGFAIGGLAVWLVARKTDISMVREILVRDVDAQTAGVALVVYGLFFLAKAQRWRYLLEPVVDVPLVRLSAYVLIGYAGNVVLPFQTGEIARAVLLSRCHGVKVAGVLSGIALEKLLDFFALLLLLAWALWALDAPSPLVENVAWWLAIVLALCAAVLCGVLLNPEATGAVVDRGLTLCPERLAGRLRTPIHDAISGLTVLRRADLIFKLLVSSLVAWGFMLVALVLAIGAVALETPLAVAIVVMALAAVGLALPTSPGFVGTLQAAFVLGMVPFGIDQETAVAASLVYQFLTTVPPLAVGLICLAAVRNLTRRSSI